MQIKEGQDRMSCKIVSRKLKTTNSLKKVKKAEHDVIMACHILLGSDLALGPRHLEAAT